MGFPKHIFRKANSILSQRRQDAQLKHNDYRAELHHAIPELRDIERELAECGRGVIAAVAAQNGNARLVVEQLKNRSLALQKRREELILQNHLSPASYLEVPYHCPLCQDQGYVNNRRCQCMEQLLRQLASQELGNTGLENFSFQNFRLDFYGHAIGEGGTSPYERMSVIKRYCEDYVRSFDPGNSPSLLFVGGTGLGKTHLSLAIAREVIEQGHGVIYASMQNLMSRLEDERFNNNYNNYGNDDGEQRYLSMVMETDLLILDDLGTEYLNQFTSTAFYNLVNTRLLQNKPTIISTNLLPAEIGKRYSDRLVSRLFGSYKTMNFLGKDIRIQKTLMGQ